MKIAIGSDHAGYHLKRQVTHFLEKEGIEFRDFGAHSTDSVDYPDVAQKVAESVVAGEFDKGILVCGTGIGISIAANKVPGIRAAVCTETFAAKASREHNDANILALGERVTGVGSALEIVKIWLSTEFSGDSRHANRINKISGIEHKYARGGS
jgi:ribose 5-phosphate isomerase B